MVKKLAITGVIIIVLAVIFFGYLNSKYAFITIMGNSMAPTYTNGSLLVIEKQDSFEKDQVVVFRLPNEWREVYKGNDDNNFVKRVSAVEGDRIDWNGSEWSVNGEIFAYVKTGSCEVEPQSYTLKPGEIFVTGDTSTDQTMDSREAFCKNLPFTVSKDKVLAHGVVKRTF